MAMTEKGKRHVGHETKCLTSKTTAVQMRYKSLYIS